MGLDITAYARARYVRMPKEDDDGDDGYEEGLVRVYVHPEFPRQADGMENRSLWLTSDETHSFRSGYGGYNVWRNRLCEMANGCTAEALWAKPEADVRAAAFGPLIHFSDCEGTIGPETSKRLLDEFLTHRERAVAYAAKLTAEQSLEAQYNTGADFLTRYDDWTRAFTLAADGGFVRFH